MYLPSSTIDDADSFLAPAVHFGLRLFEDHTPSSGPVCISLGLQFHAVSSIDPMPGVKGVAHTTLLKECHDMPEKEHTSLAGWLLDAATGLFKERPSRNRALAMIRRASRFKPSTCFGEAVRGLAHNLPSEFALGAGCTGWFGRTPGARACNCAFHEFAPVPLSAHFHDVYDSGLDPCDPTLAVEARNPQLVRLRVVPPLNLYQFRHHYRVRPAWFSSTISCPAEAISGKVPEARWLTIYSRTKEGGATSHRGPPSPGLALR